MPAITTIPCPLCGASGATEYCSGSRDARRKIERTYCFWFCAKCRLRFQIPSTAPERLYDEQDQAPADQPAVRRELRCDADVLQRLEKNAPGKRLLDIGAGDGRFLESARNAGWDCLGVDVSERLARFASERSGVKVLVGSLAGLQLPAGSFDVVNLDQVLMYVQEPAAFLTEVGRILGPRGICRIREYDADSLSARRAGKTYWMYAPTHLLVWSYGSIARLAAAAGFEIARSIPGTEASFESWLETERTRGVGVAVRCAAAFVLRRVGAFGRSIAADKVYYLRKP